MTILDDDLARWPIGHPTRPRVRCAPRRRPVSPAQRGRPPVAPLRHRGTGLTVSQAAHTGQRPVGAVSGTVTAALAILAGLITLWLGMLGHAGAERAATDGAASERLAVVQVQAGETLQQLARRVAPEAPAAVIAERIRDLNGLGSSAVEAGQTLISPID